MIERIRRSAREVDDLFRKDADAIAESNWASLKYLSLMYLACLAAYYLLVCMPQGVRLQTIAVTVALCAQIAFSGSIWLIGSVQGNGVVSAFLVVFATLIASLGIFLGTVVFPYSAALLFPLMLIMMTQFYTIRPNVSFVMLTLFAAAFLALAGMLKPRGVFMLDVLSTTVAYTISLVSICTATRFRVRVAQKQNELNYLSEIDPLTKLLNRAGFIKEYARAAATADPNARVVLAMVDIDDFKSINDRYGHLFGDKVLQGFSDLLRQYFTREGSGAYIGRFGGDEFIILIEGAASDDGEARFREFLSRTEELRAELNIDSICSIGAVVAAYDPKGPEALIDVADKALYGVKQSGGGDVGIVTL